MKLNLNRKAGGVSGSSAPASSKAVAPASKGRSQPPQPSSMETYGRSQAPPPPGSSYWEFLYWASEGGTPFTEDTDLAVTLWMGVSEATESVGNAPRPR